MCEFWCEYDINPLIIFNQKGNIIYCNQEAEIFLSYINKKEVFEFVIQNAPSQKGVKTEFKKVKFKEFEFNGYTIGYEDEKKIGVRFFINTNSHSIHLEKLEKVDLSMLIKFAAEYLNLKQETKFSFYFDPSIPEIFVNKNALLNLIFEMLDGKGEVFIETKVNVGEYIKINHKKYPIVEINLKLKNQKNISNPYFEIKQTEDGYTILLPLIKENDEDNHS
ncbi:MAG: hypothetical protein GXO62_03190 [Epsilonproteobacteria bacterium]|nr:hypothetical protein [Campylobacterota bacterium]